MNSFLKKIYAYKFFDDFILIYPFYVVMFSDFHLSTLHIGIILAIWSISTFLLEVPSGALADKYSRKNILFYAQIIQAIGYAIWMLFPSFFGFLIGFIFWGIKSALASGTFEALVFDELKKFKKEKEFTKIIGRTKSIATTAILFASIATSGTIFLGYGFVIALSIASLIISALLIISLPKSKITKSTHETEYYSLLKKGVSVALKNPIIFKMLIFITFIIALGGMLEEFWPLFGKEAGLPKYLIGLFLASLNAMGAIGSFIAYKFEKIKSRSLYLLVILNGIFLVIATFAIKEYALFVFAFLFIFILEMVTTILEGAFQHSIPTETRATISSVKGFTTEISAMGGYIAFGVIASAHSLQGGFLMVGLLIVLLGLLYFFANFKNKKLAVIKK